MIIMMILMISIYAKYLIIIEAMIQMIRTMILMILMNAKNLIIIEVMILTIKAMILMIRMMILMIATKCMLTNVLVDHPK